MVRQIKDIAGMRFGNLIAIKPTGKRSGRSIVWECVCDCGESTESNHYNLINGNTKSCGCLRKLGKGGKLKDITGMRFGKLVAIDPTNKRSGSSAVWKCICDCGKLVEISSYSLTDGRTKSCGCIRQNNLVDRRFGSLLVTKYAGKRCGSLVWECLCDCGKIKRVSATCLTKGYINSCGCKVSIFYVWQRMKDRCYNPKHKFFHRYGGRGIKVCEEWHSLENFHRDMGDPQDANYSLGRIDNDKGYSPDNCRWETNEQQQNNKSTNRFLIYNGETKTISQLARISNLSPQVVHSRIHDGWSIEKALTTPVRKQRKKCNEDFKSTDFPQPQPFTKEVFDDAIAMIEKWDFTIEKGS